ncbi:MAG: radical SAM protein [Planctomycetota bacterium]|nr:MAG: radical SAM protein [Planctomycetota bacterium]
MVIRPESYFVTSKNDPRGYIEPSVLKELWFHTGTACNLSCDFCLEGSKPNDTRLGLVTFEEVQPFIDEAVELGVEKFSFTGGEPFVCRDMIKILEYALERKPCLVLSNGTEPLEKRLKDVAPLIKANNPLSFRISFDWPDPDKHDKVRGKGNFRKALETMKSLEEIGFGVSIARQMETDENKDGVDQAYKQFLDEYKICTDISIIAFPDFLRPGSMADVPEITEGCMVKYLTEEQRNLFMCNFSKMIIKKDGQMRVYACTLVDDDEKYDCGGTLKESMDEKILLGHHRCYSCFAFGSSCSES